MYRDETGYKLWCFAEQRMYGAWDVYKRLLHKDPHPVFQQIWRGLTEEQKDSVIDMFGEVKSQEVPYQYILDEFKKNKINYKDLCVNLQKYFYEKESD